MRPQLNFRAPDSMLGIKNINFGPFDDNTHYSSSFLTYLYPVSLAFVNSSISGPKNPISALKLNPVPKNQSI